MALMALLTIVQVIASSICHLNGCLNSAHMEKAVESVEISLKLLS
jgi:outer membrane murein-binding lipoprotein Lpp